MNYYYYYYSEDEIHPELRFTGAGILAMANSGPNTNGIDPLPLFESVSHEANLKLTKDPNFLLLWLPLLISIRSTRYLVE